jgi:hypothetical protein
LDPFFVTDDEYLSVLNARARELCQDELVLTSAGVLTLAAKADTHWIYPSERMLRPRMLLTPDGYEVKPIPYSRTSDYAGQVRDYGWALSSDWRTRTGVRPEAVICDMAEDKWFLAPAPEADMSLTFEGWMWPRYLTCMSDQLDMPDNLLQVLHLGVLADVFNVEDEDTMYDANKSADYMGKWFAAKVGAGNAYERVRRGSGRAVRYGGI